MVAGNNQNVVQPTYSIDEKVGQTYVHEESANTLAARDYKQPQAINTTYGLTVGESARLGKKPLEESVPTMRAEGKGGDNMLHVITDG